MYKNRRRMGAFLAVMMLCFAVGCSKSSSGHATSSGDSVEDTQSDTQAEETQTSAEMQADAEESVEPDSSMGENSISTQFFTLTLPESYEGGFSYHYFQDVENETYSLQVCERTSEEAGTGGILFTITVQSEEPDYLDAVPCKSLGNLVSEDEKVYHAVLLYPSDVQFDESTEAKYTELYNQIDSVIAGFSAAEGYSLRESAPE